jgi:REP element-mobilizing transposase RayT
MALYRNKYRIETFRLQEWDYSQDGYYFITTCVKDRECIFGEIIDDSMKLNEYSIILKDCWFDLPNHYPNIKLDAFCIMPNHIHGIIVIDNPVIVETGLKPVSTTHSQPVYMNSTNSTDPIKTEPAIIIERHGLFEFVRALKTFSARRINLLKQEIGHSVWQSRFHDHIIRDDDSLQRIREYIVNNPTTWQDDKFYN